MKSASPTKDHKMYMRSTMTEGLLNNFAMVSIRLAQTIGTCTVEIMPVSVIAQVTKFNKQLSKKFDFFYSMDIECGSFRLSNQF